MDATTTTGTATTAGEAATAARSVWRRRQLLDAAAQLMSQQGFSKVAVQTIANQADVSVGLLYRYYRSKEDLLLAVIVDVLDHFAEAVPQSVSLAGDDPVEQIAAAFRSYCHVIDEHRHAAMLTYRESGSLTAENRKTIKIAEVVTIEPIRSSIQLGQERGIIINLDPELLAYDLVLMAHGWALKHWYFQGNLDIDGYIAKQSALYLSMAIKPEMRDQYKHLIDFGA